MRPKETVCFVDIDSRGSTKHTAFPRSQSISILLYTKSQRNEKIKRTSYEDTRNILIIFQKNVKFNFVNNVIHKTFAVFGCPKVACSRDGARDFLVIHPVNNALSPLRVDAN